MPEPLAVALRPGEAAAPPAVASRAARALLDLAQVGDRAWPPWLAPHQVPAAERGAAILKRFGGALLADAVGLGKSYIALAVALSRREPFALVVPAVLVPQWRALLARHQADVPILTHESLSAHSFHHSIIPSVRLFIVDEAHRFRNPDTNRYRALAQLVIGAGVLLVTATPVHNRVGDAFHLFRLFLRDHALAALGVPSLHRAAAGAVEPQLARGVAARLIVARSRARARSGYDPGALALSFPDRAAGRIIRAATAPPDLLAALVRGVTLLRAPAAAGPLFRLMLLRRLASSLAAFRASLARHEAFLELSLVAAREGRALTAAAFQSLFSRTDAADLQLVLFPMVLEPGSGGVVASDLATIARLRSLADSPIDPKADALERLLDGRPEKTIVFTDAQATVRHLVRLCRGTRRVAAVSGSGGGFAAGEGSRGEVLRSFAPLAQGADPPRPALETDLLIATDLLSEGLNLQDASRVIHYDVPWNPARLAQRVGRIDRLGSPHPRIETITFLPPEPLAGALALEQRLAAKVRAQASLGAAQLETVRGADTPLPALDWCDRLEQLARGADPAPPGGYGAVAGTDDAVVLVARIGKLVEAVVVTDGDAVADASRATELLELGQSARAHPPDRATVERAIATAAPLLRARLAAVQDARWRASDRDRVARRLIPWVLTAARRAARRGVRAELALLDALVSRLALGMTAGEESSLDALLARPGPLGIRDLVRWHGRMPPLAREDEAPEVELVAALAVFRE